MSCTTPHNEESKEHEFIETVRDCYLHQHNLENSRHRGNDEPSLLDLVLTDESMQVTEVLHQAPLGKSDHNVITFQFNCYLDYSKPREKFDYNNADFDAMEKHLVDSNWTKEYLRVADEKDIEELWEILKSMLIQQRNKFVPKKKMTSGASWKDIGGFPIDKSVQMIVKKKHVLHRKWIASVRRGDGDESRLEYTRVSNKAKRMVQQCKRKFEASIANKSKSNPKSFWMHVRNKLKTKEGVAPLLNNPKDKESMKFTDKDKADILQRQFSSVFIHEPNGTVPTIPRRTDKEIRMIEVTVAMVEEEIERLNENKSCGPDEIHPKLLKKLMKFISEPLTVLLNRTMREGQMPVDWKGAFVTPIFKKGSKNIAENYRPISLTSLVCKLMESFVKTAVMTHLITEGLLSKKQFGFISGRSTTTQLLHYLDKCIDQIVKGSVVDSIYLDFAKAFDTVPHMRLLGKLTSYGITGNIHNWIKSFLTGRTQTVKVNGVPSETAPVISGIPQGSVLGPVLFIVYINDILDSITSDGLLFADDTKIFRQIRTKDDALALQSDIDKLEKWSDIWLLKFNPTKCHVLTLGRFEDTKYTKRYTVYGNEMEHVFEEKDLGITIDSQLTFGDRIAS